MLDLDGDVLKFAGDAFLAYWPCELASVDNCSLAVAQLCVRMQLAQAALSHNPLRVKLAVAQGHFAMHYLEGSTQLRTFMVSGSAVDRVAYAQDACRPGDVVLSEYIATLSSQLSWSCQPVANTTCSRLLWEGKRRRTSALSNGSSTNMFSTTSATSASWRLSPVDPKVSCFVLHGCLQPSSGCIV